MASEGEIKPDTIFIMKTEFKMGSTPSVIAALKSVALRDASRSDGGLPSLPFRLFLTLLSFLWVALAK